MSTPLRARHEFAAPPAAVLAAMADPAFHASLRLPDVREPEVLGCDTTDAGVKVAVRFEYTGTLDPIARRVVGRDRVSWVQYLSVDAPAGRARLEVVPDIPLGRVDIHADLVVRADDEGSVRTIEGIVAVRIPLIGGRAESSLAPGILRRLDLEAAALEDWLTRP